MKLYMIRHGESETNVRGCYTGWAQASLTGKGREDARKIRPILQKIKFDKIYTSDLDRAIETARCAVPDCEYESTPILREINLGSLNGRKIADCKREFPDAFLKNGGIDDYTPFGGESSHDLAARVQTFLDSVSKSGYETVAAFSHLGVLKSALGCVLGVTFPRRNVACANCTIAVFEYDTSWRLSAWIDPDMIGG